MRDLFFHATGHPQTRLLVQLMPYLFQRTSELRHMRWAEINWDRAIWKPAKMKTGSADYHKVPLPTQTLDILHRLQAVTGGSEWVFQGRDEAHEWCWDFVRSGLYTFTIETNDCNRALRAERVGRMMQMNPLPC